MPRWNNPNCGFQKGHKPTYWKGGRVKSPAGYIFIFRPEHPFCNSSGYVREHRLVMEKHLGRYLKPKERVHHINEIKDDNRLKNLKLFPNENKHKQFEYPKGSKFGMNI